MLKVKKKLPHLVRITNFVGHLHKPINPKKMQVAVWDTYVTKKDGTIMHFDIIAPSEVRDTSVIYDYGKEYLKTKDLEGQPLTSKECKFCHIETVKLQWEGEIRKRGYFIYEMENCE